MPNSDAFILRPKDVGTQRLYPSANWGGQKPWRNPSPDCGYPYTCYDDAHAQAGRLQDGIMIYSIGFVPILLKDGSVVGDWRLPTKTELVGITTGNEAVSADQPRAFINVQSANYWSSTTHAKHKDMAYGVKLDNGASYYTLKSSSAYLWPVRGGQ